MNGLDLKAAANISANTIFIGCNFGNSRVKGHFDALKRRWEANLPIRVYLSDRVCGEGARDLWHDITLTIRESNLSVFDVTSFRPNVVLELGFALANKQHRQIVICRDLTPGGRTRPVQRKWLLSDIGHLNRNDYKSFASLDKILLQHVERMAPVRRFYRLVDEIERKEAREARAYIAEALDCLIELRDRGPMSRREFNLRLRSRDIDAKKMGDLLIRYDLAKPTSGKKGTWMLID